MCQFKALDTLATTISAGFITLEEISEGSDDRAGVVMVC